VSNGNKGLLADSLLGALLRKQEGLQRRRRQQTLVVDDEMNTYETISGETIEYTSASAVIASFIERVRAAAHDPGMTVIQLEALVYGLENPLLSTTVIPGRAVVTASTYADPAFHVMLDLIGRKRVATGHLDLNAARARHTLTVRHTARQLGVSESAVRQAIQVGRLSAWKDAGTYYLDPVVVGAFRVSRRGPKQTSGEPLSVRCGSSGSVRFSVNMPHELTAATRGKGVTTGHALDWRRIAIIASSGSSARMFIIEPADRDDAIEFNEFYVRGRFKIVHKENNAKAARDSFKAFTPE
jgi:hypothetical protein